MKIGIKKKFAWRSFTTVSCIISQVLCFCYASCEPKKAIFTYHADYQVLVTHRLGLMKSKTGHNKLSILIITRMPTETKWLITSLKSKRKKNPKKTKSHH